MRRYSSPRVLRKWLGAVMLAIAVVSVTGCSAIAVRLGWRVRLDTVPVTSVSASLASKRGGSTVSALGPGQSARLVVVATTQDGKQFVTVGAGKGKVAFDNYVIEATVVQAGQGGKVSLSSDPRISDGKVGHLRISPTAHSEVVAELNVPVRYDLAFVADFAGARGIDGLNGTDGLDGMPGSDGSPATIDPTTGALGTQGPGGPGTNGSDGGRGEDGGNGAPGDNVHAWIRLEPGPKPLLQVKVSGTRRRESLFIVDPHGGSLKIRSDGGPGGQGGHGGRGGRGGSGGSGFPSGTRGLDGLPGSDGLPGNMGAGGTITLSVDPAAQPFLSCISWSNRGSRGSGPPPQITIEPVAALW